MTKKFDRIFKKILESVEIPLSYGYWVGPDGNVVTVNYQNHGNIAIKIISKNEKYDKEFSPNVSGFTSHSAVIMMALNFLFNKSWVKLTVDWQDKTLFITNKKYISSKQNAAIEDIALRFSLGTKTDNRMFDNQR